MFKTALLYEQQGKLERAEHYYLMAVEKGDLDAMCNLAILYHQQGKLELAEHYYLMAAEKGDAGAMCNLAILYHEQGNVERAEHYYLMVVEEGDIDVMRNLATLYCAQAKLPREALELSRKGVVVDPSAKGNLHFGVIALWNEEYHEAFSAIDAALTEFAAEIEIIGDVLIFFPIVMLVAKGQTAFALKLFEDERYQNLNFKERFKPFYYAILHEIGESRRDDALRMGPELEETVKEIRSQFEVMREQYRLPVDSGVSV